MCIGMDLKPFGVPQQPNKLDTIIISTWQLKQVSQDQGASR